MKPLVKWAGGKRQLLPEIRKRVLQQFDAYYEPFVGGGAVLFDLCPDKAYINDANAELINAYQVVRDDVDALLDLLYVHEANDCKEYYYEIRSMDRDANYSTLSDVVRAARFIYLNKTCFNGLYRVNSKGYFNVPYGRPTKVDIVNESTLRLASDYLSKHVELTCGSYIDALSSVTSDDFVYFDPPYVPLTTTSSFTSYTSSGFDYLNQVELRDKCVELRDRGVHFLQSNSDCDIVRDLYSDFIVEGVYARRAINSVGSSRGAVSEVLISW